MAVVSCTTTVNTKKKPKTALDSFSYVLGLNIGKEMKNQGVEKLDYSTLLRGIEEGLTKDSGYLVPEDKMRSVYSGFIMKNQEKKVKEYKDDAQKFLNENAKKAGVTILPSKAQFIMTKKGDGPAPQLFDTVEYSWTVKTHKGKILYDGIKIGEKQSRAVSELGLLPLEEAFQKSPVGSSFELYIPNDLFPALGRNAQNMEEMYSVTIFTANIIGIKPGKAPADTTKK